MKMSHTAPPRAGAAAVSALLLAALTACASTPSASTTTDVAVSEEGVAAAKAALASFSAVPTFTPPGEAVDVASLTGKTIYAVAQSSSNPFVAQADASAKEIAESLGITWVEYSTQGTTAEWARGITAAIDAKADAILLNALDPRLVSPQLQAASDAGIPVISAQFFDLTQSSQVPPTLAGTRSDDFTQAAKLEADQAIVSTDGKADVVVVGNTEQLSTQAMFDAIKAEFAQNCQACTVKYVNVPSSDWATKVQSEVQSALVADPGINWVIPVYDPMTQFVVPAITASSKTDSVHISTFNGTPAALKMLAEGPSVKMDVGENLEWLAYANLDQLFRAMSGKPTLADEKTALRVFTSENVAETGNPPAFNTGFGDSYVTGYRTLWGVN